MSLRTIADLPALDVESILSRPDLAKNLEESLFEISYLENIGMYNTYNSRHVRFGKLSSLILNGIADNNYNFYGYKIFWDGIGVYGKLQLSGNLLVNEDLSRDVWEQYRIVLNAGDITINSSNTNLCSDHITVYTNDGQLKTYDGSSNIVSWNDTGVHVYKDFSVDGTFNAANLSCTNLTAANNATFAGASNFTGTAYFTNVIQGCSLCAKWADLAELYRSDADYAPGTLVRFGGPAEITVADGDVNAVITDKPGLILNGDGERDGIYKGIALVGRTPVMASGPVRKFDRLTLSKTRPGVAVVSENGLDRVIGVAFGEVSAGETKLVECAVQLAL